MIESRRRLRFVLEPPFDIALGGRAAVEDLHCNRPVEFGIESSKHGAHTTAANELFEPEMTELAAFEDLAKIGRCDPLQIVVDTARRRGRNHGVGAIGGGLRRVFDWGPIAREVHRTTLFRHARHFVIGARIGGMQGIIGSRVGITHRRCATGRTPTRWVTGQTWH